MLFVSKGRRSHSHAQIYEKDLESGKERRITFQNGSTAGPRYHPKEDWILYASSTDELKEDPPMLKSPGIEVKFPFPYAEPFELYMHSPKGLEIMRLTNHQGFDGEGRFNPDGSISWTRAVNGKLQIVSAPRGSKQPRPVKGIGANASQWTVSSDGKIRAWVEWTDDFTTSRIKLQSGKLAAIEVGAEGFKSDLRFSPDAKFLLWAQVNPQTTKFEIWSFEIDSGCARKLLAAAGDRRHPIVSPDLKWLTFTSWRKDRSRIAQVPYEPAAGPCTAKN